MALGYLLGIGLAIVLYLAVRSMERDYYKRKHEIIQKKFEKLNQSRQSDEQ